MAGFKILLPKQLLIKTLKTFYPSIYERKNLAFTYPL